MTKADICNVEPVSADELRAMGLAELADDEPDDDSGRLGWMFDDGPDAMDEATKRFHLDVIEVDRVLRGYLRVNDHEYEPDDLGHPKPKANADRRDVYVTADRYLYENNIPPIGYEPDWCEHVEDHGGNVAKAVVALLKWNVEKHQEMLDVATQRLRDADLLNEEDEPETVIAGFAVS